MDACIDRWMVTWKASIKMKWVLLQHKFSSCVMQASVMLKARRFLMLNQTYEAWVFATVPTSAGLGVLADPGTREKDTVRMLLSCFKLPSSQCAEDQDQSSLSLTTMHPCLASRDQRDFLNVTYFYRC